MTRKHFNTIPRGRLTQWNQRQRKKLRVGEYQEFVFRFCLSFSAAQDDALLKQFFDDFYDFLETLKLSAACFPELPPIQTIEGIVQSDGVTRLNAEHQTKVLAWFKTQAQISNSEVGELIDAWHGWD